MSRTPATALLIRRLLRLAPGAVARWAARRPVTLSFSVALAAGSAVLATRGPAARSALLLWASTNLDNLQHRPGVVLILSAFLPEHDGVAWVALSVIGLGLAERFLGPKRAAILVAAGHLIGTAVSEGLLWFRIHLGAQPPSELRIVDVGPSFVVVTALVAAAAGGAAITRIVVVLAFVTLAPDLLDRITQFDVASVGHVTAAVVGAAGGWVARRRYPLSASFEPDPCADPAEAGSDVSSEVSQEAS